MISSPAAAFSHSSHELGQGRRLDGLGAGSGLRWRFLSGADGRSLFMATLLLHSVHFGHLNSIAGCAPEELKKATGDVFGRIYEYFLTQFADLKAHDNGEFFTLISLVALIANVIEPAAGTVLDPACGSGGMFVQSAHFVERMHASPTEKLSFRGLEKNPTTIRLAKMNLAVHGLEGDIQKAITYYEDHHELLGKADFVMANPPFNVDEADAEKVKNDPRLPFGRYRWPCRRNHEAAGFDRRLDPRQPRLFSMFRPPQGRTARARGPSDSPRLRRLRERNPRHAALER